MDSSAYAVKPNNDLKKNKNILKLLKPNTAQWNTVEKQRCTITGVASTASLIRKVYESNFLCLFFGFLTV